MIIPPSHLHLPHQICRTRMMRPGSHYQTGPRSNGSSYRMVQLGAVTSRSQHQQIHHKIGYFLTKMVAGPHAVVLLFELQLRVSLGTEFSGLANAKHVGPFLIKWLPETVKGVHATWLHTTINWMSACLVFFDHLRHKAVSFFSQLTAWDNLRSNHL